LLARGQNWAELPYVARRDAAKDKGERTVYQGLGQTVTLTDPETGEEYPVRHVYIRSRALAQRAAKRRQDEMAAIEAEIQRIQSLVNNTTTRRQKSSRPGCRKKRAAQRYFEIKVVEHSDRREAPLELLYMVDHEQIAQDADLNGVYLLVAGGPAAEWEDASLLQEWEGQYKVEHCFRLTNQVFLVGPVFLKNPHRIVALIF
jgi:transposase